MGGGSDAIEVTGPKSSTPSSTLVELDTGASDVEVLLVASEDAVDGVDG